MFQCCASSGRLFAPLAKQPRRAPGRLLHLVGAFRAEEASCSPDATQNFQHDYRGLLIDAAGTLISPSEPVSQVYRRHAVTYGCRRTEAEILAGFRRAFNTPWARTTSRYVGDGRPFWEFIVRESTGCDSPELLDEVYAYYSLPEAWKVAHGAEAALRDVRAAGIKLGLVSNFDTRLRPLLTQMKLAPLFDCMVISAEEGFEKPNPVLFETACTRLGVSPGLTVHIGDDRRNDVQGARLAGCHAWLWGSDVHNFEDLAHLVIHGLASEADI